MSCACDNHCKIWLEAGCADPDLSNNPSIQEAARKDRADVCRICKIAQKAALMALNDQMRKCG